MDHTLPLFVVATAPEFSIAPAPILHVALESEDPPTQPLTHTCNAEAYGVYAVD
jgi:hypothetical protein